MEERKYATNGGEFDASQFSESGSAIPNSTERSVQHGDLERMFHEASRMDGTRQLQGPYYKEIVGILETAGELLGYVRNDLGAEQMMPTDYQSAASRNTVFALDQQKKKDIMTLRNMRREELEAMGRRQSIDDKSTQIPDGVLDTPPFIGMSAKDGQSCFRTCFRMVYNELTGTRPSNVDVGRAILTTHESLLIHDTEYLNVFLSPSFKKLQPGLDVQVATITGADLDTIRQISEGIKQRKPEAKVYCIINLRTLLHDIKDVWHTNVLLSADDESVTVHDPSRKNGLSGSKLKLTKDEFYERWAVGFNRAHLVIAA